MYPITNEVKALFEAEHRKVLRITGTDKNGATITITDNNVIEDSFQIDRYSCNGEKLEIGTAVAAQMSLTLENGSGQYNGIVFEGAELFVEVGIADWTQSSPTITYVPCGYFTPDDQPRRLSTISITGLDRMTKFDVVVDATDLTFPTTIAGLVGQVCTLCGVALAQSISGLVNAGVTVTELPTAQDEITYRNLIQWCAGIMGTNAWFDWNGQLRFSWYANLTGYVSTVNNRYSSDLYEDDLTVSGVEYTNNSGIVIVEGTDDYAIDLTGNAIAGPLVATVLPPLNTAMNGFTYRPFTAATVNAPYLWPMDIVTFTDKDGNDHTSALTNVAFGLNGTTALESKGMTYAINKAAQPKGFTKEQAQLVNQAMDQVETNIDESLTQQEIFNRLTDNGAAQGLLLYNGQLYINASYIQAGRINVGLIDFTNYDDYEFLVPNEYDSTTLFPGQSIVDGWITHTSNTITVVECDNATALQGKRIVVSVETKTLVSGGSTDYATLEGGGSEVWGAPAYGQEDAEGNLIGATGQGEFYRYETSWVVPDDATWFSISFDTTGARAIRVSADTTSDFALMYGNNIAMSYKGLQVGKFIVDKSGNVTSGARNQFDGAVYFNGSLYFDDPAAVRTSLGVPSTTGSGASGTWGIDVTGSAGSVAWGNVSGKPSEYTPASGSSYYVKYHGNLTSLGSGTPAAATKTYWSNDVGNGKVEAAYNTSGDEYSILFGRGGSASYGCILKFGYPNRYMWILRMKGGSWQSDDWEKIYAGYADSAGSATTASSCSGNAATATTASSCSGNAASATQLQTARSLWGNSFNGTADISGTIAMAQGSRIHASQGALYIGNSGNQNWVYFQDMASQDGSKWKIHQNGNAKFNGTVTAGALSLSNALAVGHGGTGSTSASGARTNLGIHSGRTNVSFSNGVGTIAFSTVGISSRPEVFIPILNTTDSTGRYVVYAYQDSSSSINLRLYSGTSLVSGSTARSISWICIA